MSRRETKSDTATAKESVKKEDVGLISTICVLQCQNGKVNNLQQWLREMETYVGANFGYLVTIFVLGKYKTFNPIETSGPTALFAEENETSRIELTAKINSQEKALIEMHMNKPKVFNVMLGNMSAESKDKVKQDTNWTTILAEQDPLELLKIIKSTHIIGQTNIKRLDTFYARESFETLKQKSGQSLYDFKHVFEQHMDAYKSLGITELSAEDQAFSFIQKLNDQDYGDLKRDLENMASLGKDSYPTSLQSALLLAINYRSQTSNHTSTTHAATFATTSTERDQKPRGDKDPKSRGDKKRQDKHQDAAGGSKDKKLQVKGACVLCGKTDHWTSKCDWLGRCREVIEAEEQEKEQHQKHQSDETDEEEESKKGQERGRNVRTLLAQLLDDDLQPNTILTKY